MGVDIPEIDIGISLNLSSWSPILLSRTQAQAARQRSDVTKTELSELLFGIQLSIDQLRAYRERLLQTIDLAERLESMDGLPELHQIGEGVGRGYRVGQMAWYPPSEVARNLTASSISHTQALEARKMVDLHSLCRYCGIQLHPRETACTACFGERSTVVSHREVIVARGSAGISGGEEVVELTWDALADLLSGTAETARHSHFLA